MLRNIHGTITALITPFNEDGSINFQGLRENIQVQIKAGVSGLLALGTTGETPTLSRNEQTEIIKLTVEEAKASNTPVIVGVGTNSTYGTVENSKIAEELGADALLVVTPYYNKPTQAGIIAHFDAVNSAVNIPIIVYNIAGRTGTNIETPTLKEIAKLSNVQAVKEASGNMLQVIDVLTDVPEISVFCGDDSFTYSGIGLGAHGVISVASNVYPEKIVNMTSLLLNGEFLKAREMHFQLMPLFKALFVETNPTPVKTIMDMVGQSGGSLRLPLLPLSEENFDFVKSTIQMYQSSN